ncbi:heme-binding protein [Ensifer sp. YR511]|uniref:GlcG/HbpS family heme-binding protein n=1 Tax=Ensifer sp. YR511 TaxID=1855294 RepID=UPI0008805878|nr:heme-binding protein [Ensifer sp. YR511]SDN36720.1 Uncharacterized conserved protein GlcG, DUF336 family [Ensifer sp. YR511]
MEHPHQKEELVVSTQVLAANAALRLVGHVIAHATANAWRVAVCVVDTQGVTLAAARMDEVAPPILDFAMDKAFTAATMRRTTEAFFERMDNSPSLRLGLANRSRLLVWGGGLPILHRDGIVGAIGVSGARDVEDIECARHALEREGLSFEI